MMWLWVVAFARNNPTAARVSRDSPAAVPCLDRLLAYGVPLHNLPSVVLSRDDFAMMSLIDMAIETVWQPKHTDLLTSRLRRQLISGFVQEEEHYETAFCELWEAAFDALPRIFSSFGSSEKVGAHAALFNKPKVVIAALSSIIYAPDIRRPAAFRYTLPWMAPSPIRATLSVFNSLGVKHNTLMHLVRPNRTLSGPIRHPRPLEGEGRAYTRTQCIVLRTSDFIRPHCALTPVTPPSLCHANG